MSIWLLMVIAGLVTFCTRLSFILLLDRLRMPDWFQRALRFVPAAVLSAIIVPELASQNGTLNLSLSNAQIPAGIVAIIVAWRTRNILLTIGAGMAALLILQAVLGK